MEERIERLERLYEKIHHDYELLGVLIPRLTDILSRYWAASGKHRKSVGNDHATLLDYLKELDQDVQLHFKEHSKLQKAKVDRGSKRTTYTIT